MSIAAKLCSKMILDCLIPYVEPSLENNQNGSNANKSVYLPPRNN